VEREMAELQASYEKSQMEMKMLAEQGEMLKGKFERAQVLSRLQHHSRFLFLIINIIITVIISIFRSH
jgi:hypothetical protein